MRYRACRREVATIEYRTLGGTGLKVSVLSLGTMTFGGVGAFATTGSVGVDEARAQLDRCLDAGVNLVDTADVYSGGRAEEILGDVLKGRRDQVVLATKVRFRMGDGPNDAGLTRHHVIRACEASLRRLGTDHIDLYQMHEWDGLTPVEETLVAFDLLVRAGKVRYVGVSNFAGWQVMKLLGAADRFGLPRVVSQQIYYSVHDRDAEYELLPVALDQNLGILVFSPLAGGLLSGSYRRRAGASADASPRAPHYLPPVRDHDRLHDIVDALVGVGAEHGVSAARVALAFLLRRPGITSVLVGARHSDQLADSLGAAELHLTDDQVRRLDDLSYPPLIYPYWHQVRTARDRLSSADLLLRGRHLG
jgi:aryl-alcohol dehydrogenase-like predicted oxidoreductase